jgi:hypothetical protein
VTADEKRRLDAFLAAKRLECERAVPDIERRIAEARERLAAAKASS